MPNFFYIDKNGVKQGPINDQQLKALAARGIITPNTVLETADGHKGTAEQIPGLIFNAAAPSTSPVPQSDKKYTQQSEENLTGSIVSWLLDFSFQDLRLPIINLWACRIIYVICCVAAILWAIGMTLTGLASLGPHPGLLILVPLFCLGAAVFIFLSRLFCEWYIVMFDWIIETTKAARLYNKEKSGK